MNKPLIVYIPLMILCKLKKMLKQMVLFFVLQLLAIMLLALKVYKLLIFSLSKCCLAEFRFSVSGSGFSKN
jgi:hypothetical protein